MTNENNIDLDIDNKKYLIKYISEETIVLIENELYDKEKIVKVQLNNKSKQFDNKKIKINDDISVKEESRD